MESQPQNPGFRINPENFHPCELIGPRGYKIFFTEHEIYHVQKY